MQICRLDMGNNKKQFDFPDCFGKNFDAFWDCLRDCFMKDVVICVKGLDTLPENFEGYMQKFIKVLNMLRADSPSVEIEIIS